MRLAAEATGLEFNAVDRAARLKRFAPDLYEKAAANPKLIKRLNEELQARAEEHHSATGRPSGLL